MHELRLHNNPFELIKSGIKTIEMRLYDEKRKLIKEGDIIRFTNRVTGEIIDTKVIKLHLFNDFNELYNAFDCVSLGYKETKEANPQDMEQYDSKEEQCKYGVVAIEIELI